MRLEGTIQANLESAINSARRLRDHPVYPDTLLYWQQLMSEARRIGLDQTENRRADLGALIVELENELADRTR